MTALAICTIRPYYHLAIDEYGWKHILKWIFYYGQPQADLRGPALVSACAVFAGLYALIWLRIFDKKSITVRCYALVALILAGTYIRLAEPVNPSHEPPPLEGRFRPLCCRIPDCRILRKSHKTSGKNDAIRWFSDSVFCGIKLLFRSKTQ